MINTTNGTYQCDGSCNAQDPATPSNSLCPIDATCGNVNGASTYNMSVSNLCGAGNGINGSVSQAGNTYFWTCNGSN
jgi:hypothetical protein